MHFVSKSFVVSSVCVSSCFFNGLAPVNAAPATKKPVAKPPAKNTKPAPKPAQKPAPGKPAVKGTTQMAGDQAVLGTTYTLGREFTHLNFTLDSAEFSIEGVKFDDAYHAPKADEKVLLLKYTVQNPIKEMWRYDWGTLKFTAVDIKNTNREYVADVGKLGTTDRLAIDLKPAQKISAYSAIIVPAKGVIPKLIVQHHDGGPVLRYDLRTAVKGLEAPYADAADKFTALEEVKAEAGQFYPLHGWYAKLVSTTYAKSKLGEHELEEGQQFFVAAVTIKNQRSYTSPYDWGTLKPLLVTADGEKNEFPGIVLKTARNENASGELKPGEEYTLRLLFRIPKDTTAKTLYLAEPESRSYVFDVSNTK